MTARNKKINIGAYVPYNFELFIDFISFIFAGCRSVHPGKLFEGNGESGLQHNSKNR